MKLTHSILAALAIVGMTACTDEEGENYSTITYNFEFSDANLYTEDGYWTDVYTQAGDFSIAPALTLSHAGNSEYQYFTGFCPSSATETADVSAESVVKHQWSSVTGSGVGSSSQYVIGMWNSGEDLTTIPENPALKLDFTATGVTSAVPQSVYVANTNYAYWVMKKGCAYNHIFGTDDWFKVIFKGVKDGVVTGTVEQYLAKDGTIYDDWKLVNLSSLGSVDYIYVQMQSTDNSEYYGVSYMNNPAYVCLDNLVVTYYY
jgi:hypothetical protein